MNKYGIVGFKLVTQVELSSTGVATKLVLPALHLMLAVIITLPHRAGRVLSTESANVSRPSMSGRKSGMVLVSVSGGHA